MTISRIIDEIRNQKYEFPSAEEVARDNGVDPDHLDMACSIVVHNDESEHSDSWILRTVYPMSIEQADRLLKLAYVVLEKDF